MPSDRQQLVIGAARQACCRVLNLILFSCRMDSERLKKMAGAVRTGGKGTMRRYAQSTISATARKARHHCSTFEQAGYKSTVARALCSNTKHYARHLSRCHMRIAGCMEDHRYEQRCLVWPAGKRRQCTKPHPQTTSGSNRHSSGWV